MKRLISICSALMILLMSVVAFANTDITDGVVVAEGVGAPGQLAPNGYRAAKLDAMRNLLEQVGSVRIDSQTIVKDSMIQSDVVRTQINGLVKGANVVRKYKDDQGYFHVIIELPVYGGSDSLAASLLPKKPQVNFPEPEVFMAPPASQSVIVTPPEVQPAPAPAPVAAPAPTAPVETPAPVEQPAPQVQTSTTTVITTTTVINPSPEVVQKAPAYTTVPVASGTYTGVIVDCQGLGIQTAMAPAILAPNHKVVYGLENFSHDEIISRGYVSYSKSFTAGVERAGSNPLIIKATGVESYCSPVISEADAAMMLQENKLTGFLTKGNVVFVK